jgi:hypothetical protein
VSNEGRQAAIPGLASIERIGQPPNGHSPPDGFSEPMLIFDI